MGQDITYSGTVTAALEAAIQGVPALAVSLAASTATNLAEFEEAARVAVVVAERMLVKGLPPLTILNLNVPFLAPVKGIRLTRQGVRIYQDELARNGSNYRIVGPEPTSQFEEEGTDVWAVHNGYASLTPIHLDMTAHHFIADLAAWDIGV
jgi:5'-nucleotidase